MQPQENIKNSVIIDVVPSTEERAQPWRAVYPQTNTGAGYKFEQNREGDGPRTQGN